MFEFLIRSSAEAASETAAMLGDLDAQITKELVERYVRMSKGGGELGFLRAMALLHYLSELFERAKRQRTRQGAA
jgi:hypothetical protein